MPRSSLLGILALLGLLAAGYLLWDNLQAPDATAPQALGEPASSASGTTPPPAVAATGLHNESGFQDSLDNEQREALPTNPQQVTAAPPVRIRGRLVDRTGAARSGVTLRIPTFRSMEDFDPRLPVEPPNDTKTGTATTTSDGSFEFLLAKDAYAFLELPSSLVFAAPREAVLGSAGSQDLGQLVVHAASSISGQINDSSGRPVPGVKLNAYQGAFAFGNQILVGPTGDDGRFTLPSLRAGSYELRTASAAHQPTAQSVTVGVEEHLTDIVLVVQAGLTISGQVVDDRGWPIAGARVASKRAESRGAMAIERFTSDEAAITDAHGYFSLAGLADGLATIRASATGHATATQAEVAVGRSDLVLRLARHAVIEGVLVAPDQQPLAGSQITANTVLAQDTNAAEAADASIPRLLPGNTTTDAKGAFRLAGLTPGLLEISATGSGHRPVRHPQLELAPGQILTGLRLIAERGSVLRAYVTDSEDRPVAGARVAVQQPALVEESGGVMVRSSRAVSIGQGGSFQLVDGGISLGTGITDAEGWAEVAGLPTGDFEVHATHAGFAPSSAAKVTLTARGSTELRLQLQQPGFLAVLVHDDSGKPVANATVKLTPGEAAHDAMQGLLGGKATSGDSKTARTDAEGRCKFGPVAPGNYRASLARSGGGRHFGGGVLVGLGNDGELASSTQQVTIVAGKTAELALQKPTLTRLHGVVTDLNGPVADCVVELASADSETIAVGIPGLDNSRSTNTDATGAYQFADVEPGSFTLRYGRPEAVVRARRDVAVASQAEQRCDLMLRSGSLRIQAWDPIASLPIAGAEVSVVESNDSRSSRPQRRQVMMMSLSSTNGGEPEETSMTLGKQSVRTGADGWAEITDLPPGTYDLRVEHRSHAPSQIRSQIVEERQLTESPRAELGPAGRVRGKVLTANGSPPPMAVVEYEARDAVAGEDRKTVMAQGGKFACDGLAPGRYAFRARGIMLGTGGNANPALGPEVLVDVLANKPVTVELKLPQQ